MTMRLPRWRCTVRLMLVAVAAVAATLRALPMAQNFLTARAIRFAGSLHDKDTSAHYALAEAVLNLHGGKASVGPLIEALRSPDRGVRFAAAIALGTIGPEAADAVPALTALLEDGELYVRQNAPESLARLGPAARPAVPALIRALKDKEWMMQCKVAVALHRIAPGSADEMSVDVLVPLLSHGDPVARHSAGQALREVSREVRAWEEAHPGEAFPFDRLSLPPS
jgi:HEAT repeat protein